MSLIFSIYHLFALINASILPELGYTNLSSKGLASDPNNERGLPILVSLPSLLIQYPQPGGG